MGGSMSEKVYFALTSYFSPECGWKQTHIEKECSLGWGWKQREREGLHVAWS